MSTEVWRKGLKKSRERERKRRNETKKNFSFNMKKQNMIHILSLNLLNERLRA